MLQVIPKFQFPCLINGKIKGQEKKLVRLFHFTKTALWKGWLNYGQMADGTSWVWMCGPPSVLENQMIEIGGVWKIDIS